MIPENKAKVIVALNNAFQLSPSQAQLDLHCEALAILEAELRNPEPEMPDGGGYVFMGFGQKHVRILITKAEVSSALEPMALLRLVASKALHYMEETK